MSLLNSHWVQSELKLNIECICEFTLVNSILWMWVEFSGITHEFVVGLQSTVETSKLDLFARRKWIDKHTKQWINQDIFWYVIKNIPIMDCIQKKVWISNVFTINFKGMSILEDEIFMCVTPCKMDPLYTAGQCMCVCACSFFLPKLS